MVEKGNNTSITNKLRITPQFDLYDSCDAIEVSVNPKTPASPLKNSPPLFLLPNNPSNENEQFTEIPIGNVKTLEIQSSQTNPKKVIKNKKRCIIL